MKHSFKGTRFSWGEADKLIAWLAPLIQAEKLFWGGSYVRRNVMCGDLDVAILKSADTDASLKQLFTENGHLMLVNGSSIKRLALNRKGTLFQLDVWLVDTEDKWGPLCMFVAGNGSLNILQRRQATARGCVLSQYGVTRNGVSLGAFPTEQSVYAFFGWPWIPYEKRNV